MCYLFWFRIVAIPSLQSYSAFLVFVPMQSCNSVIANPEQADVRPDETIR